MKCERYSCNEEVIYSEGGSGPIIKDGIKIFPALCAKHMKEITEEVNIRCWGNREGKI